MKIWIFQEHGKVARFVCDVAGPIERRLFALGRMIPQEVNPAGYARAKPRTKYDWRKGGAVLIVRRPRRTSARTEIRTGRGLGQMQEEFAVQACQWTVPPFMSALHEGIVMRHIAAVVVSAFCFAALGCLAGAGDKAGLATAGEEKAKGTPDDRRAAAERGEAGAREQLGIMYATVSGLRGTMLRARRG